MKRVTVVGLCVLLMVMVAAAVIAQPPEDKPEKKMKSEEKAAMEKMKSEEKAPTALKVKVGDPAPDFAIPKPGSDETMRLSDLKGKKNVMLAFYPRAFSPACTRQLCGYRDDNALFMFHDMETIAVSLDPQETSNKFKTENKMMFHVIGDPEGKIAGAYGIPVKEDKEGNKGAQRSVILIGKDGLIKYIDANYNPRRGREGLYKAFSEVSGKQTPPEMMPAPMEPGKRAKDAGAAVMDEEKPRKKEKPAKGDDMEMDMEE